MLVRSIRHRLGTKKHRGLVFNLRMQRIASTRATIYLLSRVCRPTLPMMSFTKRTYKNFGEFLDDFTFPIRNRRRLSEVRKRGLVSPALQERLMMAVTAVNGCRYCSYFHAREALKTGIEPEEIRHLLAGSIAYCPDDEAVAVMYAQHWAESNAHPDSEAVERLRQTYGTEKADAIHLMLRLIRMGNLMGNTWDYFLHRISFGKWGGMARTA